eukprot:comp23775_c0_seq1/m.41217 comp23775_c0_seq1/g.41217  ORF comp23775_c0_seq1/g.41217 comp23775_c0_seq1/m.41217 type:complete len:446 (-) comp23775_c0_seq1:275-1612(-)
MGLFGIAQARSFSAERRKLAERDGAELRNRIEALKASHMFQYCSDDVLVDLAMDMKVVDYRKGDVLVEQEVPQNAIFLIVDGEIVRERSMKDHTVHTVNLYTQHGIRSFGALHVLKEEPAYARAVCRSKTARAYVLTSETLRAHLAKNERLSFEVIYSLSREVRHHVNMLRTPLLQQQSKEIPLVATAIAASIESFYRSALNATLNFRLTGQRSALFPNMHVQLPARVMYICGIKGIRHYTEHHVDPSTYEDPEMVRLGLAFAPGVLMTPMSSILEACNAGHMNPEPLWKRWSRGLVPRTVREIIFGLGLNQLSDYCEERVGPLIQTPMLRTAAGSMIAGVLSGYLSHVPHNLSTLKMVNPKRPYHLLMQDLALKSLPRVPPGVPKRFQMPAAYAIATIFPRGLLIRTTQLVGSFMLLNGTIELLKSAKVDYVLMRRSKTAPATL